MATSDLDQQQQITSGAYDSREEDEDDGSEMTLVEHLQELRWRIFKSLIAIAIGAIIAFIFRDYIIAFLQAPLPQAANVLTRDPSHRLVVTGLLEGFSVFLKLSIAVGFFLAIPVILYQVWAFIAPGLYQHEKKKAIPFILIGIVLFLAGITLGFVVLRYPVEWFVQFASTSFTELVTADSYFTFVAFFVLAFGLVFELPLVLTFLAQVGLVSEDTFKKKRAVAHVGMWIASTFLTPGADVYSPIILGVTMSCLYELSILFIHFFVKKTPALEEA